MVSWRCDKEPEKLRNSTPPNLRENYENEQQQLESEGWLIALVDEKKVLVSLLAVAQTRKAKLRHVMDYR